MSRASAVFLSLVGIALVLVAFRIDPPTASGPDSWHDRIHNSAYPIIPTGGIGAVLAFAWDMRNQTRRPWWQRLSLAVGVVMVLAVGLSLVDGIAQLARYLIFLPFLVWLEVIALVKLRGIRSDSPNL